MNSLVLTPSPGSVDAPTGLARKIPHLFICVFAADILFFRQAIGLSATVFIVLLLATYLLENRGRIEHSKLKIALVLPAMTLPALLENVSLVSAGFAFLSIVTVALADQVIWVREPRRWLGIAVSFPLAGLANCLADGKRLTGSLRRGGIGLAGSASALSLVLPIGAFLIFLTLFAVANPVIAGWMDWLLAVDVGGGLDFQRVFFWLTCLPFLWPLVRGRISALDRTAGLRWTPVPRPGNPAFNGDLINDFQTLAFPRAVRHSLVVCNMLFAIQMLLDAVYLVGGATLPDGMTYAEYAHRGAYPLVIAALLAGAFVIVAIRPGSEMERTPLIRRLVFAWIGQTLLLLGTSLWRLDLYVAVYSLTYLRAAAAIWMVIVGFGLVWIVVRLFANKPNAWLVKANLLTILAILHACCFVDFGGRIAMYNIEHSPVTGSHGRIIDLAYLSRIGAAAIPALDKLALNPAAHMQLRMNARDLSAALRETFEQDTNNWRGFTFRRYRLSRYVERNPIPNPVAPAAIRQD